MKPFYKNLLSDEPTKEELCQAISEEVEYVLNMVVYLLKTAKHEDILKFIEETKQEI